MVANYYLCSINCTAYDWIVPCGTDAYITAECTLQRQHAAKDQARFD